MSHRPAHGLILACHLGFPIEPHAKLPDAVGFAVLFSEVSIVAVGDSGGSSQYRATCRIPSVMLIGVQMQQYNERFGPTGEPAKDQSAEKEETVLADTVVLLVLPPMFVANTYHMQPRCKV